MGKCITVELTDDAARQLDEASREEHVAADQLVNDLVRRFLAVRRFRELRKMVLPFAEAQGILTDEDVFKTMS